MILWNVAYKKIEARHDGKVFEFAANERKKIFNPDVCNHLIFKLKTKGLVILDEETITPEIEKKALIDGLKARWKTLDYVVRNFRTLNKEREANKLTAESPSEAVMNAAEEASDILNQLKELESERYAKIDSYLKDERSKKMSDEIDASQPVVETKGSFETEIRTKRKSRNVPSSNNS